MESVGDSRSVTAPRGTSFIHPSTAPALITHSFHSPVIALPPQPRPATAGPLGHPTSRHIDGTDGGSQSSWETCDDTHW